MTTEPIRNDRIGRSVSGLHYHLGKLVETIPGGFIRYDNGETVSTDRRYFEELEPVAAVNFSAIERLEIIAADARAEMGEQRWQQLNAEWSDRK